MHIQTAQLPSTGWNSGLPDSFDMRPFGAKQLPLIAKAFETKDMRYLVLDALQGVLDIDFGRLSVQDAHALVLHQRMEIAKTAPLYLTWKCHKPIFMYEGSGPSTEHKDEAILGADSCAHVNLTELEPDSFGIIELTAQSEEFDLARMCNYEVSQESTFNWVVCHMGDDFYTNIDKLNAQEDLQLWGRLIKWTQASKHGVMSDMRVACASCNRQTLTRWELDTTLFMV